MKNEEFSKRKTIKYLAWTFGLAWTIQVGVAFLYRHGNASIGQLVMAVMMFVPTLGVYLAGGSLGDLGWKPQIRGNGRPVLIAWFLPAILTAVGALLYFAVFPGHFDLSGKILSEMAGEGVLQQLEEQGITYPVYILVSIVQAVTYAPLVNMFPALGEEIGWRGFLYPQLTARFGRIKGSILGGIIWGAWHWPLIWLIGYEYGYGYAGFPVSGMLIFCVSTTAAGVLCSRVYEQSKCIWVPSLCHGAFNAAGTIPLAVWMTDMRSARLLGPVPVGLISMLPFVTAAVLFLFSDAKKPTGTAPQA